MKRTLIVLTLIAFGMVWTAGCTSKRDQVVAQVGEEKITVGELVDQFVDMKKKSTIKLFSDLPEFEQLRKFLEQRIDSRLMMQKAYEQGFDEDPEIKSKVEQERERALLNIFLTKEIVDKIKITDKDVKDFYEKSGERAKARHILLRTKKEADQIYQALKKGANFDSLARERSIDIRTKDKGGDLGSITWYSMVGVSALKETVFKLNPQEFSRPVKTFYGWHIIELEEKSTVPPQKSFEEEKERMRMNLQTMRQQESLINYMINLMEQIDMRVVSSTKRMLEEKALVSKGGDTLGTIPTGVDYDPDRLSEEEKALPFLKYKGGELSVDEFLRFYNRWPPFQRPPLGDEEGLKNMVFNQLLAQKVLENKARQQGIDKSQEYENRVKLFEEGLIAERFRNEVIWKDIAIEQTDLESFYQRNKDKYIDPAQVHLLEILVKTQREAQNLLKQLRGGADFEKLAQEKTLRTFAKSKGGDIGFISKGTDPELFESAFKLKEGEIGGPVHLLQSPAGEGYSVIKLLEKKEQKQRTLQEVEPQVRGAVTFEKKNNLSLEWVAEIRSKTEVDINQSALDAAFEIVQKELPQEKF